LIARLIEFKELGLWPSHVELVETDNFDIPIRVLGSRYPDGVAYRSYYAYAVKRDVWYAVRLPSDACERAWGALGTLIGHTYDFRDIIGCKYGLALNEDWHTDGKFICSEAVAWAFEKIGCPLFNPSTAVSQIVPGYFLLTPLISVYKVVR